MTSPVEVFVFVEMEKMAGEAQEIVDTSEDDAAAQAAFDAEVGGGIPTATPEPKTAEEVKPEPEPEPAPVVEYAQITKAEYADLMAKANQVDKAFGKIGGIERVLQQLQTPGQAIEVNDDDFKELSAEYPELARSLIDAQKKVLGRIKGSASVDPAVVEKIVAERVEKTRMEMINSTLDQIVGGDWVADRHSEEFKQWEAAQPAEIQNLAASDDLRDAARMMRAWRAHKDAPKPAPAPAPKPSSRRQQLEAAAATPKGTGGSIQANPNSDEAAQAAFDAQFT